jgi:hypothetical protein
VRFLGFAALIGLSLSILGASTAASADQCPQKESPFRTDRPDVTNSSLVVPQGSFQSENGINFTQRAGNHEFDGTNSRLRWGIAPRLEVNRPLWVIRDRCSRSCLPIHVRFGPKATAIRRCREMTLWATSGLMHRSEENRYSITSSAVARSVGGMARPSALAVLRLMISSNFVGS